MNQELRELQAKAGATFERQPTCPSSFDNDTGALRAVGEGVALWDRSHWGLLQLQGSDRSRFLHNQTTNHIERLQPGQGCEAVFVTSTGRTLDLATVYVTENAILVLVSPQRRQSLLAWMDRFIFPMDRVELTDISEENAIFTLIGPESDSLLRRMGLESIIGQPEGNHALLSLEGASVRVAAGSSLALPGYTAIIPTAQAASLWGALTAAGAVPLGERVWDQLRIQQGRPVPDRELTEDYNPLEAGLWKAISFDKGCYIGQETIARLNTYQGVKQRLWGIKLSRPVEAGSPIVLGGEKIGMLTSCTELEGQLLGLGYVRTRAGGAGLAVEVGGASGEVTAVPFLTHP